MANKGGQRSYPCLEPLRKVKHCDISSLVITAAIGAVQQVPGNIPQRFGSVLA